MSPTALDTRCAGLRTPALAEALGIDDSPSPVAAIDRGRLASVAEHMAGRAGFAEFSPAAWDDPLFWNAGDPAADRSQLFAIGNAINFRFWRLEDGRMAPATGVVNGRAYRGSMYMWRSLRRTLDRGALPLLDAAFLAELSAADFDAIFTDDEGVNPLDPARDERLANLRDLGRGLLERWDGHFHELARRSDGSLAEFVRLSRDFRAFDDPLYKLTMVNAIMHSGSGVAEFRDEPLPAIDYHLLRHLLRQGILRPRTRVRAKLLGSRLLDASEAYELRRLALAAFVELSRLSGISGEVLDNRYWLNRANCRDLDPVCLDAATARQCPFLDVCAQLTDYALPLELTRYY